MTTLECGHPERHLFRDSQGRVACRICLGNPSSTAFQAALYCGLPCAAFDDLTNDEHGAFWRAICADPNPTGLDPRLVYASYLEEQDDPRGELIRVECELAGKGPPQFICHRCDGTGRLTNPLLPRGWQHCPHCEGTGNRSNPMNATENDALLRWTQLTIRRLSLRQSLGYDRQTCAECDGRGGIRGPHDVNPQPCPRCGGTGRV